jgi:glycosyltransferase involved in cell wall biosynthesis
MKVLIFSETTTWGGLESHAVALAETLVAEGHRAVIVCLGPQAYQLYGLMTPAGITLVQVDQPARRTPWTWWRALRNIDADAVVLEKGTLHTCDVALDCVLRLKYRRFITVQQLEPPNLPPKTSKRYLRGLIPGVGLWWYRWVWSGYLRSLAPELTVCVSEAVRRRLITDYGFSSAGTLTIPNGVDPSKFQPNPDARRLMRTAWGLPERAVVFGSVGRLSPQKALDVAIEAFGGVVRACPDDPVYLVLVGDGPERAALLDRAQRLGIHDRVILPGFSPTPSAAYQGLDYFLIPSRFEGLPFSLVEAMASGCQVIGTTVGGIPEVITNASLGTLVAPEDPSALAQAMIRVMHRDPAEAKAEIEASRKRVAESYDIRVQCSRLVALLQQSSRLSGEQATTVGAPQVVGARRTL